MNSSNELFSEIILELYKHPMNRGRLSAASVEAAGGNPICGDKVTIFLRLQKDVIVDASFENSGCAISTAAASLLTERIKGKTVFQALSISPDDLFEDLGGIIQTRIKCATLALVVLKEGLKNHQKNPKQKQFSGISV